MTIRHVLRRWHAKIRAVVNRATRSPKWRHVEKAHLVAQPYCLGCGTVRHLQVHHVRPFHLHPELELDPNNLVTACMDEPECHLRIGHGDSFRAFVPKVLFYLDMARNNPEGRAAIWLKAKADRLIA